MSMDWYRMKRSEGEKGRFVYNEVNDMMIAFDAIRFKSGG